MSTDYEPGTVAMVMVSKFDSGVIGFRRDRGGWALGGGGYVFNGDVYDVRTLVVLDLDDYDNRAVTYLRNIARDDRAYDGGPTPRAKLVNLIADQIEAQVTPPRIPEPGPYGLVEAGHVDARRHWVRGAKGWTNVDASGLYLNWSEWDDLIDPTLIREGLS